MSDPCGNLILAGLPSSEISLLKPHLVEALLETGTVIAEAGVRPEFVYFPLMPSSRSWGRPKQGPPSKSP